MTLGRRLASVGIGMYVLVQLALPLHGLVRSRFATQGRFSWNMYSFRWVCRIDYRFEDRSGRATPVDLPTAFNQASGLQSIFHRDSLPAFNAWLCRDPSRRPAGAVALRGSARCWRTGVEHEAREMLVAGADLCAGPDYGVARE